MTMIDLPRPVPFPGILWRVNRAEPGPFVGDPQSADGSYRGLVLTHDEDMVVTHLAEAIQTITGTVDLEYQVLQADAFFPTGTLWSANTKGTLQTSTTGLKVVELDAPATISAGSLFCFRRIKTTATGDLRGRSYSGISEGHLAFPYNVYNDGSDYSVNFDGFTVFLGKSATEFYPVRNIMPCTSEENNQWNNTSGDLIRGNRMQVPQTMRVCGLRRHRRSNMGDGRILLCNDAGDILTEGDYTGALWSGADGARRTDYFDAPVVVNQGDYIRFCDEPTTATNISETVAVMPPIVRSAWPFGADVEYAISDGAVDGGGRLTTWTDRDDALVPMDLMIDQVDNVAAVKKLNMLMLRSA